MKDRRAGQGVEVVRVALGEACVDGLRYVFAGGQYRSDGRWPLVGPVRRRVGVGVDIVFVCPGCSLSFPG